jgi:hypothetical protein
MRRNPEHMAWAVLTGAFCIFCTLVLLVPLGLRWWVLNSAESQRILMVSSGTVLVTRPGRTTAEVNLSDIPVGSAISIADADSQATLTFVDPRSRNAIATVKIYGNTKLSVTRADSPRYGAGQIAHTVQLQVLFGRLHATAMAGGQGHPVSIELASPPNVTTVVSEPGSEVALVVNAQTSLTVRQGQAIIMQTNAPAGSPGQLQLLQGKRAEAATTGLHGPLPPERRLVANEDFSQPLGEISTTNNWVVQPPQQNDNISGTVSVEDQDNRKVVHFYRQGIDLLWGKVGISQNINQDVRDFKTLRLQMDLLVTHQDLFNCGELGSECPVMVEIKFQDTFGQQKKWLKGFFYNFSDRPGTGMIKCPQCDAVRSDHQQVPQNEWVTIESENLVDLLRQAGNPPAQIQAITLYASGHAFDSEITNVQLLGSE